MSHALFGRCKNDLTILLFLKQGGSTPLYAFVTLMAMRGGGEGSFNVRF